MSKGSKSSVVKGAEQALAFLEGKANGTRVTTVELAAGTVRSIRRSLKLSQARFGQEFGSRRPPCVNGSKEGTSPKRPREFCWLSSKDTRTLQAARPRLRCGEEPLALRSYRRRAKCSTAVTTTGAFGA
jgi:hypothetical protein